MHKNFSPIYCDYIAEVVQQAINKDLAQAGSLISGAGRVRFDMDDDGVYISSNKLINVADINGRLYEITIKEVTK